MLKMMIWASAKPIRLLSCAWALGYPVLRSATATKKKFARLLLSLLTLRFSLCSRLLPIPLAV